jgi:hypothetical protein
MLTDVINYKLYFTALGSTVKKLVKGFVVTKIVINDLKRGGGK